MAIFLFPLMVENCTCSPSFGAVLFVCLFVLAGVFLSVSGILLYDKAVIRSRVAHSRGIGQTGFIPVLPLSFSDLESAHFQTS